MNRGKRGNQEGKGGGELDCKISLGGVEKHRWLRLSAILAPEPVQGAASLLQGEHNVQCGDRLPAPMLGVRHGILDQVLQERLEHGPGLLVDGPGDPLHTSTACQPADGGLGDPLDLITQHLAMTLGTTLAQSLATFTTSRHGDF